MEPSPDAPGNGHGDKLDIGGWCAVEARYLERAQRSRSGEANTGDPRDRQHSALSIAHRCGSSGHRRRACGSMRLGDRG